MVMVGKEIMPRDVLEIFMGLFENAFWHWHADNMSQPWNIKEVSMARSEIYLNERPPNDLLQYK